MAELEIEQARETEAPVTREDLTVIQGRRLSHEQRMLMLALLAGLPGVIVSFSLLWTGDFSAKVRWTLSVFILGIWAGVALALREQVTRPLQTLSNLLAALRESDYSLRARGANWGDALGEVMIEVNALGRTLREQRLGALEATHLLRTVMAEIDVAVFAFDGEKHLQLVNRAGERLLDRPHERLIGANARDIDLADFLEGEMVRTVQATFPGGGGRWSIRRGVFYEKGRPHQLLVISDLSRELREEERQAWQRLVRVLSHELNNSLTPIKSIAGSLRSLLGRDPLAEDWLEDTTRGLSVIESRADSLSRFMQSYARLARLPPPKLAPVEIGALVRRVAELETRIKVTLVPGPELILNADRDQLEQLLINLIRNGVDAALTTGGGVCVRWGRSAGRFELSIEDEGPGLANTANLFVPFFTTKPGGSGIGLVLSRQIAEAHGGTLVLRNRSSGRGCEARLTLPG